MRRSAVPFVDDIATPEGWLARSAGPVAAVWKRFQIGQAHDASRQPGQSSILVTRVVTRQENDGE